MELIVKLDQHELSIHSDDDGELTHERTAVRAVALNDKNEIALINFANIQSSKLPGGGVDEGEDLEVALRREITEEIGYEIAEILGDIGIVDESRYYSGMHQMSYCYIVRVGDFIGTNPTTKELARGIQTKWFADIDSAIKFIEQPSAMDEEGSPIGLKMMNVRDIAILNAAKAKLPQSHSSLS